MSDEWKGVSRPFGLGHMNRFVNARWNAPLKTGGSEGWCLEQVDDAVFFFCGVDVAVVGEVFAYEGMPEVAPCKRARARLQKLP